MAVALKHGITRKGFLDEDLVRLLENVRDLVNELRADHATYKTTVDEMKVTINALVTDMATRIANHNTLTTKLNADAGVTDTNYAAAGAITAVAVATSSPATLANNTDLTFAKG